jgi:hypothetical protein
MCVYTKGSPIEIQTPGHWHLTGRPDTCVIAQQYSSATFVSLHFHSRKEEFGARFKRDIV